MADESLHKKRGYLTLHTESFSCEEVKQMSIELNGKFGINSRSLHKKQEKP